MFSWQEVIMLASQKGKGYLFKIWLNSPFAFVDPWPDWSWATLYMRIPYKIFLKGVNFIPFPCSPPGKLPNSSLTSTLCLFVTPFPPTSSFFHAFLSAENSPLWGETLCHKDTIVWDPSVGLVQHLMSFLQLPTLNCLCIKQDKNKETNEKSRLWWYKTPSETIRTIRHSTSTHVLQKKITFPQI